MTEKTQEEVDALLKKYREEIPPNDRDVVWTKIVSQYLYLEDTETKQD